MAMKWRKSYKNKESRRRNPHPKGAGSFSPPSPKHFVEEGSSAAYNPPRGEIPHKNPSWRSRHEGFLCSRNGLAESLPAKVGAPFRGRRNPEAASYSFILVIYLFQRRTAAVLDTDHWVGAFSQGHSTRHKSAVRPSGLHETKWGFSFLQWEQGSISKSSSCSTIKTAPHQTFLPSESARKRRSSNRP